MTVHDRRSEREKLRREKNKQAIIKAAEAVFSRQGYGLARVDDIAREVQFSKATLYRYFRSKREIFIEVIRSSFTDLEKIIAKIQRSGRSAEQKLRDMIHCVMDFYKKKENIVRIFFIETQTLHKTFAIGVHGYPLRSVKPPRFPGEISARMRIIFDTLCDIIDEGVRSGEFRSIDIKSTGYILGAMIRGFHFRGPARDINYNIDESTDLILNFFLHGIKMAASPSKGA